MTDKLNNTAFDYGGQSKGVAEGAEKARTGTLAE